MSEQLPEPIENHPEVHVPGERQVRPQIWVGSLADYNAGRLHGEWIDGNQDVEALEAATSAMLARSREPNAEEFAIFDYDDFGGLQLSEYEDLATISRIARGLAEHGEAFAAWVRLCDDTSDGHLDRFNEAYRGRFASVEAFVVELLDDFGLTAELANATPEVLQGYVQIDTAALARDLPSVLRLHVVASGSGGVWIFEQP